jgi:hypothetical protein
MFYQLNLLLLLIAPLLAYLAAALMFSLVARQKTNQSLPQNTESVRFRPFFASSLLSKPLQIVFLHNNSLLAFAFLVTKP